MPLPVLPPMTNHGNYIASLGNLCRWLAKEAEELGVEIYPGYAATEVLYAEGEEGAVCGIATNDMGMGKDGKPKANFERGMELHAGVTLFGEGCRGSLTRELLERFKLREAVNAQPQTYGIGIKEVWKVPDAQHNLGEVTHTFGWPMDSSTYGGSFMYHWDNNQVSVGFVVALDYENPYMNPYQELQVSNSATRRTVAVVLPVLTTAAEVEAPPHHQKGARGGRVHLLWSARDLRGWTPVPAQAQLPWRRPHRRQRGLFERASDQGHARSHEVWRACSRNQLCRAGEASR